MTFEKHSQWWSIVLCLYMIKAGLLAIGAQLAGVTAFTTVVSWSLLFTGATHLAYGWHNRGNGGFVWELLIGLFCGFAGVHLLADPLAGRVSITYGLAISLLGAGVIELICRLHLGRIRGSNWLLFDGVLTLILALMIWRMSPSSAEWAIGTLLGIRMMSGGFARLMLSMASRRRTFA